MKLYCTELVQADYGKAIADPVRIEVFRGPREYDVLVGPRIVASGTTSAVLKPQRMRVAEDRTYIEIIARTEEAFGRRQYCEDHIDRVVAQLSAIVSPRLFEMEVWSGWLCDQNGLFGDSWLMTVHPVSFNPKDVEGRINAFRRAVSADPDIDARFTLMSKLFARAVATEPGEERFLWLWTVLEVFPMKDTSNIQPISDLLSRVTGRPAAEIKERLGIGPLFGARSSLVHDGKLPYGRAALGAVLKKLEAIDSAVIRSLGGLPYSGELEEFLGSRT
jgi:hypothetical protein